MKKVYVLLIVVLALGAAAFTYAPLQVLRAFEAQDESDVTLAYTATRYSPAVTVAALVLALTLLYLLFRQRSSWWLRVPAILCLFLLGGAVYASRINFFTTIGFAPMAEKGFAAVDGAELPDEEMVIGVTRGGESKAYPIGIMAYHHVLNDEVGGEPLVVTY